MRTQLHNNARESKPVIVQFKRNFATKTLVIKCKVNTTCIPLTETGQYQQPTGWC